MLFYQHYPEFAFYFLIWVVAFIAWSIGYSIWKLKFDKAVAEYDSKLGGAYSDAISNIFIVKSFALEQQEQSNIDARADDVYAKKKIAWILMFISFAVQGILTMAIELILVYLMIGKWQIGAFNVGEFVLFQSILLILVQRLWEFGRNFRNFFTALADASEMAEIFEIAIVGSGPAGCSAAARAASLGVSHVLLEKSDHISDTIFKYQRGKYIMSTPNTLPLQSDLQFEAESRENILGWWEEGITSAGVNIKYNAEVSSIAGTKGDFTLTTMAGDTVRAKNIILAINKMDLVDYDEKIFKEIETAYLKFAAQLSFDSVTPIPLSALNGDNIISHSDNTPWYKGPTLISHLEAIEVDEDLAAKPFRMPVQWVNRPNLDFRGFSGTIASGVIRKGDGIVEPASGQSSTVKEIVTLVFSVWLKTAVLVKRNNIRNRVFLILKDGFSGHYYMHRNE